MQLLLLFLSLISFSSFSAAASWPSEVNCTEGLKARATLKFSECQDKHLPVKWCHEQFRDTLDLFKQRWYDLERSYDLDHPNKTHEDEFCKTRKKLTSCDFLKHLTEECGAHYDICHSPQEKNEIIRMWIKQFIAGTHEVYWEFYFLDDNQEIIDGKCNGILREAIKKGKLPR